MRWQSSKEAKSAGAIGYRVRTLAQATLPHLDPKLPNGMLYSRNTGLFTLTVAPTSPKHGVPYGSFHRIITEGLCTEIILNKDCILSDRTVSLGNSQADFLCNKAETVIVNKRSMTAGYAGQDNALLYMDKTIMTFGDGKMAVEDLVKAIDCRMR